MKLEVMGIDRSASQCYQDRNYRGFKPQSSPRSPCLRDICG